jgi:hypothetical protein
VPGHTPQVALARLVLAGQPEAGQQGERARPPVRLARRDAVHVRAARLLRVRRVGDRELGEPRLVRRQAVPQQFRG